MTTPERPAAAALGSHGLVLRNALILVVAQALTTPLSALVNFMMGRYLGPADFGRLYLAGTFCAFGFLLVEWGQGGTLPAMVARERGRAGELLGSALAWRLAAALVVSAVMAGGMWLFGYDRDAIELLALVAFGSCIGSITAACLDAIRGFERTDISAFNHVGGALLNAACVVGTLLLGGGLLSVVTIQAACAALVLSLVWRALRPAGIGVLSVSQPTLKTLFSGGVPFLFFGLVLALQPSVDALFLARLVPNEVIGWHAAAKRLIGVLVYPAAAIITALYPTLSRLHSEDLAAFRGTASSSIRTTTILAIPLAAGCWLYPDIGIAIFGKGAFGPAETNVRILSVFLLLLYFSMPLGVCLLAAGRQRIWSVVQSLCVVFSVVLNPLLIPYFQKRYQNGGLGVCFASVLSEVFMVALGIVLAPKGIFDRLLFRQIGLSIAAGAGMLGAGYVLGFISPFVAAPITVAAYFGGLWAIGGLDKEQLATLRKIVSRKVNRDG